MRLVDLVRQETGVDFAEIALLRHFNSIERLVELGGSVEEFTALQPKDTKWDFWRDGKPQIHVVVVIVHDHVFGVFRVRGVEAEGTLDSLASSPHREFDEERNLYKLERPTRRFTLERIPCTATEARVKGWEGREINAIVRNNAELFREIEVVMPDGVRLPAEVANQADDATYVPQAGDRRHVVERQIRERRGQQPFRDSLRRRYGDRCLVTGCEVLDVLEAAHIKPYRGENDNHPENGLLLRADIHTLFDLDLIGIEPDHLRVELHSSLSREYGEFTGKTLRCPLDCRPSQEALKLRYEQFIQRVHRPE